MAVDVTQGSKGKVLVVDDDRLVLATVTHGLAQAGFEVIDADNGDDAILLAREHRPDLALLDIRMEGKTGFDVADYLRESLGTPFMFLSAFADSATVERVRELGAVAYLVKPLDVAQIVPTVEAAVSNVRKGALPRAATPLSAAPVAPAVPAAAPAAARDWLSDPLPLAVGVLMHRYSITRHQALERLQRLADADGRPLAMHAAALVDAAELLARHAD